MSLSKNSSQNKKSASIAVLGGGISGLSTAWFLRKNLPAARIAVYESDSRWGGKITTRSTPQAVIDGGPDTFITRKRQVWELSRELNIRDQVIDAGSETSHIYVLFNGKVYPLPLTPGAFFRSRLLTWGGKLRMMVEPLIPTRRDGKDESLANFVDRRLGEQARKRFLAPVLAGIYNTNPEVQSILTTSPIMREMERDHGSLFLASMIRMSQRKKQIDPDPPPSRFITFQNGSQQLIDELVRQTRADLFLKHQAAIVEKIEHGFQISFQNQEPAVFDQVVLATPANISAGLLEQAAPGASNLLNQIPFSSIGTLGLVFNREDLKLEEPIRGLMIPRSEGRKIDAVTWVTSKLPRRTTGDQVLLRVFFGGGLPETTRMPAKQLVPVVRKELDDLLGITAEPLDAVPFQWPDSYPQAKVGHLDLVQEIRSELPPGLHVTGSSYLGVGVPDCVKQSIDTAKGIAEALSV